MKTITYHKLVRDRIPEIIEQDGKSCVCSVLSGEDYVALLDQKLEEELAEYQESKSMEELADLLEVIRAVAVARGSSIGEVEKIRRQKAEKRGGFEKRILLEEVRDQEGMAMKKEKSCGAVVYKTVEGVPLFLIEHMALGHTSIPKGHVEDGETEEQTAIREIKEETNLDVVLDTGFRHTIAYSPYPGIHKDVVFFIAEAASDSLINQECEVSALEWLPYEKAYAAMTYDTDRETLAAAKEYLERMPSA